MILRKPFALLIKNFKLIHLIFSLILMYIVYKTYNISTFLGEYINSPITLLSPEFVQKLVPTTILFLLVLLIIGYIIILVLMKYKEKPITFYGISILFCFISIILYYYVTRNFIALEINLLDVRVLKLNQDLINTMLIIQSICLIINIVRATGFNIKKFDFSKDLEDLEIKERDNEEFEFNVEFEEGKLKRNFNKFKRNFKYVLIENKLLITIVIFLAILISGGLIYYNINFVNKIYKLSENVVIENFSVTFNESLYTNKDIYGQTNELKNYVLVDFSINDLYGEESILETTLLPLEINGHKFYHNSELSKKFYDIGIGYNKDKINSDVSNYILIYEIPSSFINENMYIIYKKDGIKDIKIKVNPTIIESKEEIKSLSVGKEISLKDTILESGILKIQSYQIGITFKNNYNFCVNDNECILSTEYIYPSFTGSGNKALLKLEASYVEGENKKIDNFIKFLNTFGTIYYTVNSVEKSLNNFNLVTPSENYGSDTYYIETNSDIINAEKIWLEFDIRGKKFIYNLK